MRTPPPPTPRVDATYREYATLVLRRHHLLAVDRTDDSETVDVEDKLYEMWERLDDAQRQSLNGLSSDLNWIRRKGVPAPKGLKPEDVTVTDLAMLDAAQKVGDGHTVLHHLRICAPGIPVLDVAHRRAAYYKALGLGDIAAVFFDFATVISRAEIEPADEPTTSGVY